MKRILVILLVWTTILPASQAQSDSLSYPLSFANPPWVVGIQAGINITSAYSTAREVFNVEPQAGWAAAVFAEVPLGKYIILRPEVHLSQRSVQASGILFADNYTLKRTTTYLDVPVLVAYSPANFFKILAGPQYSYLLKKRDHFSGEAIQSIQEEFDRDILRTHTIYTIIGAELSLKQYIFSPRLAFDILSNKQNAMGVTPQYRSVYYQFMIGYKFF